MVSHLIHQVPVLILHEMILILLVLIQRTFRAICLATPAYKSSFNSVCSSSKPLLSFVIRRICSIILLVVRVISHVFAIWITIVAYVLALTTRDYSSLLLLSLLELSKSHICIWLHLSLWSWLVLRLNIWRALKLILLITFSLCIRILLYARGRYTTTKRLRCYLSVHLASKGCKCRCWRHRFWTGLLLSCISLLFLLSKLSLLHLLLL